jgi:hypothetical protein
MNIHTNNILYAGEEKENHGKLDLFTSHYINQERKAQHEYSRGRIYKSHTIKHIKI